MVNTCLGMRTYTYGKVVLVGNGLVDKVLVGHTLRAEVLVGNALLVGNGLLDEVLAGHAQGKYLW